MFYQLRELWSLGRTLLTQFVAELAAQQEERERRAFFAEYNRQQFDRRQGIEAKLREAENSAVEARAMRWRSSSRRCSGLRQFWHYFKRRTLRQRLQDASLQSMLCMQDLESARARARCARCRAAPGVRRPVDRCAARDQSGGDRLRAGAGASAWRARRLMELARAAVRPARAAARRLRRSRALRGHHGRDRAGRGHCCSSAARCSQEIKQRSERLRELAKYRSDGDTVPTAESLAAAIDGSKVLTDDLWEIYRVLLR